MKKETSTDDSPLLRLIFLASFELAVKFTAARCADFFLLADDATACRKKTAELA